MIRPRNNSPYHDYMLVFQDLRDGTLSQADYQIMMNEDLTEASRRKAWVAYLRAEAIVSHEDGGARVSTYDNGLSEADGGKGDDYPLKMTGGQASRLTIRNEPSGAR